MIPIYIPYLEKYKKSALNAIETSWISNYGVNVKNAEEKLNMNTKKIFETHIDPFHKYNMNVPPSTVVLDMNHIEF